MLPQRALYWPARHMLIVADIHFGKAAAFRAQGIPVPRGTTKQNLDALEALILEHDIGHVVFLGDFLHARAAHAKATLAALRQWRLRFQRLRLTLVRGNHDLHAGDPPCDLAIEMVNEPHCVGPFLFCHHPDLPPNSGVGGYVVAGHVHPTYRLAAHGDSVRLPCFLLGKDAALLPSFGAFTGGHTISGGAARSRGQRIFVVTDDTVFEIPLA